MRRPHSKHYSSSCEPRAMDLTKFLFAILLIVATVTAAAAAAGRPDLDNPITECIKTKCDPRDFRCHEQCRINNYPPKGFEAQ